jgi:hypothetical protein
MRTSLDLPDDLLKRAKIAAIERGMTLRDLISTVLKHELNPVLKQSSRRRRVKFPIFPSVAPSSLKLTNADLARLETDEDVRRHCLAL